jgi:hypothetical protein
LVLVEGTGGGAGSSSWNVGVLVSSGTYLNVGI